MVVHTSLKVFNIFFMDINLTCYFFNLKFITVQSEHFISVRCLCGSRSWALKDINSEYSVPTLSLCCNDCNPLAHNRGPNKWHHVQCSDLKRYLCTCRKVICPEANHLTATDH